MSNLEYKIENENDKWKIYNNFYVLDCYDFRTYSKIWSQLLKTNLLTHNTKTLLINDGDQIFYNSIPQATISTIVEPDAYLFTDNKIKKYLQTKSFLNIKDSLNYKRQLTLLDLSFKNAYEDDCFKSKYDLIFLNVKNTEEIDLLQIENYFLLLKNYGYFCLQIKASHYNHIVKTNIEHYFSNLFEKIKTSHGTGDVVYFLTFRKITSLI